VFLARRFLSHPRRRHSSALIGVSYAYRAKATCRQHKPKPTNVRNIRLTMDKVQKLNSNECYTPSSEPFRMYTFNKAVITSVVAQSLSHVGLSGGPSPLESAVPAEENTRDTGNPDRCTAVRDSQVAFTIPCVYGYIIQIWKTKAKVIASHVHPSVRGTVQRETMCRKYNRLRLGGGQCHDCSADLLQFQGI
jgi:hypothetical protein